MSVQNQTYEFDVYELTHNPDWKPIVSETEPKIRYMIAAMPRSGSNLLTRQLFNSGLGFIGEFYLPVDVSNLVKAVGAESVSDPIYSKWLNKYRQTPNRVLAVKNHWQALKKMPQTELDAFKLGGKFIFTRRRDFAMQAISWERSHQSGVWDPRWGVIEQTIERDADPKNLERLLNRVEHIFFEERQWLSYFAEKGIQPHEVYYEDMLRYREKTLRLIYRYLGLEAQMPISETAPVGKTTDDEQLIEVAKELELEVEKRGLVRPQFNKLNWYGRIKNRFSLFS